MKIGLLYEYGPTPEIGMGHFYRCKWLGQELEKLGHRVFHLDDGVVTNDLNVLVVDHVKNKSCLLESCKKHGLKTVLIDGTPESVAWADVSVSCHFNEGAQYKGLQYIIVPKMTAGLTGYKPNNSKTSVFVSGGGYDHNNLAELILSTLQDLGLNAIVAKSINHPDFRKTFSNVEISEEEDLYVPMADCSFGITAGGSTMFQALYAGLPLIVVPQYSHQRKALNLVKNMCLPCEPNREDLIKNIELFLESQYRRENFSVLSRYHVDGKGLERVVNLIDGLKPVEVENVSGNNNSGKNKVNKTAQ